MGTEAALIHVAAATAAAACAAAAVAAGKTAAAVGVAATHDADWVLTEAGGGGGGQGAAALAADLGVAAQGLRDPAAACDEPFVIQQRLLLATAEIFLTHSLAILELAQQARSPSSW